MKIGLCNYIAGGGKDTVANELKDLGFVSYALADGIYEIAERYFGMKDKDRELLIYIGEQLREKYPMLWIDYTLRKIKEDGNEDKNVVITDVRKLLEMSYLQEIGWNMIMVYCDEEVALERAGKRDKNSDNNLILNSPMENQLRMFEGVIPTIDNSGSLSNTIIQLRKILDTEDSLHDSNILIDEDDFLYRGKL